MKLKNFIKINCGELNKESRAMFYSMVKDVFSSSIDIIKSTNSDGEPKLTRMFHKTNEQGNWYIVPLTLTPSENQVSELVEKLVNNFNMGDFSIESSLIINSDVFNNSLTEDEFQMISEKFAQQLHDNWLNERLTNGWRYGENRDDDNKTHPLIKTWNQLSDNEKSIKPELVKEFVNILKSNGFKIIKK